MCALRKAFYLTAAILGGTAISSTLANAAGTPQPESAIPLPAESRMTRVAPADFRNADIVEEIGLWWKDAAVPGVLFLAAENSQITPGASFTLVPGTADALRTLLIEIGIDTEAAKQWSNQLAFSAGTSECLALAPPLSGCTPMQFVMGTHEDKRYLEIKTAEALVANYGRVSGASFIGATQLSLGISRFSTGEGRYGGASTRGILARSNLTYEYDTSFSYARTDSNGISQGASISTLTRAYYRLLAVGLGLDNGARLYAGTFGASYGISGDGGSQFFPHPALVGVAYKTEGTRLSQFGAAGKVRLLLPTESFVRIISGSVELFSAIVPPGDQFVEFQGYQDAFVDVSIRDTAGITRNQRSEVIMEPGSLISSVPTATSFGQGEFYMDAGRIVDNTSQTNIGLKILETYQASVNYAEWRWGYYVGTGIQLLGDRRRVSVSLTPLKNSWRVASLVGNGGEKGLMASLSSIELGPVGISFNTTLYRPPSGVSSLPVFQDGLVNNTGPCLTSGNALCFQNTHYNSFGFNVGYHGLPARIGYLSIKTPQFDLSSINLSSAYTLKVKQLAITLMAYLSHDLKSKVNSLSISLNIPFDSRHTWASSAAATQGSSRSVSTSYSQQAEQFGDDRIRSFNIGASTSNPNGSTSSSAYVLSQFGPISTNTSLSATSEGSYGASATFAIAYAASRAGLAFSDSGYANTPSSLFNSQSSAALALVNNSLDTQTFSVGKAIYELKPGSSQLVPRSPGPIDKWSVTPGPAEDIRQPIRELSRGQVALYRVVAGLWIQATFTDKAQGEAINPRHTFKSEGTEPVRLYPDSRLRALLYETVGTESQVTRWLVDNRKVVWQCFTDAPDVEALARAAYINLDYQCTKKSQAPGMTAPYSTTSKTEVF